MSKKIKRRIPPDPDVQNDERAQWAEEALFVFEMNTGADRCNGDPDNRESLSDLLCDLMHWCDRDRTKFEEHLRRALMHYRDETDGKGKQLSGIILP